MDGGVAPEHIQMASSDAAAAEMPISKKGEYGSHRYFLKSTIRLSSPTDT